MHFNYVQCNKTSVNLDILNENCRTQPIHKDITATSSSFQELQLRPFECWICLEELGSRALLLKHYDIHIK